MRESAPVRGIFCSVFKCLLVLFLFCAHLTADSKMQPQALDFAGIFHLKQIDPTLNGDSLNIGVICRSTTYQQGIPQNDYLPNVNHRSFNEEFFTFHDDSNLPPGISEHSTAVCSILFGEDTNVQIEEPSTFSYEGILNQSNAEIYEFWYFLKNYIFHNSKPNADIITVSAGSPFEDWWTRGFDALAQHHDMIIIAGIGNGLSAYDPPLYPAAGANIIGVGLTTPIISDEQKNSFQGFSFPQTNHSTGGPTNDMRCKPDIIAQGDCLVAGLDDTGSYVYSGSFSSFATPVVAGTAGLLLQKAKQDPALNEAAVPEAIKAILMNSATKLPYWHKGRVEKDDDNIVPLDWMQGAGMLNAVGAYNTLIAGQYKPGNAAKLGWDVSKLDPNMVLENSYRFTISSPAEKFITATVVWNKNYQDKYPFEALPEKDADLKLELWAIDSENPYNNYLLDFSDSKVDNVEHIYTKANPNFTEYEIVVAYSVLKNKNTDPDRYALAWSAAENTADDKKLWFDLNTDGKFDNKDIAILLENIIDFSRKSSRYLVGDINQDGKIDFEDLQIFTNELKSQSEK
ncbi:MAG: S8 family serine peptidase [Phycisphaerae bacterium]